MKSIEIGKIIQQLQGFKAFVPHPFPPQTGFEFDAKLLKKVDEATRLLGKLDGITKLLPDSDFFILMYLRKDAASSSQIEGTQATMIDAIEAEVERITLIVQDPALVREREKLQKACDDLKKAQDEVTRLYKRWADLEAMKG